MKTKQIIFLVISLLVIGLIIGLPFCFDNTKLLTNPAMLSIYIISKCVFGVIFIFVVVYCLLKEKSRGTFYFMFIASLLVQGVPGIIRLFTLLPTFQVGASLIILVLFTILVILGIGFFPMASKKQISSNEKHKATEINVENDLPDKFD